MKVLEGIKGAFQFMVRPPDDQAELQAVRATSERVIRASHDLAQKQDILGAMVKNLKGQKPQRRTNGAG